MSFFLKTISGEVGFYVQAVPNASHNRVMGIVKYQRHIALKVAITAPPTDYKANTALSCFLAEYLDLPRSHISLLKGHTSKLKVISCTSTQENIRIKLKEKGWIIPH